MADLNGKVVLVLDADTCVGQGLAEGFAEARATLCLATRSTGPEGDDGLVTRLRELGGDPRPLQAEADSEAGLDEAIAEAMGMTGRLDVLANPAVVAAPTRAGQAAFWTAPRAAWERLGIPALERAWTVQALAAQRMVDQGSGLIVQLALTEPVLANEAGAPGTGVAVAAVARMTREAAAVLEPHGVTVLTVSGGPARTRAVESALARGERLLESPPLCSPRFLGRCLAALAMDPDVLEKTGGRHAVSELVKEYRFSELEEAVG